MEKALYNGKEILSFEISKNYELEKSIRKASGRKELLCPDENCQNRVLKYCHGDKKQPYFAHVINTNCGYEKYDRETTEYTKEIKRILFWHFKNLGYDVQMDVKLVDRHYSHLIITQNGNKYPIEIISKFSSANRLDFIKQKYDENKLDVNWIVTDISVDSDDSLIESELNFAKRFSLNETKDNVLLTIDLSGNIITQYQMDSKQYCFDGREIPSDNYPKIFKKRSSINDLVFENGKLLIKGFYELSSLYFAKKEKAFEKKIIELKTKKETEELERQKRIEEYKRIEKINEGIRQQEAKQKAEEERIREETISRKREERRLQREKSKEYSLERIIEAINEDPPPMYNPNGIDTMVLWDKSKFENMISGIITNPVVRYKMIIQKLRYGRDEERDIFIKIYSNKMTYDERIQFVLERLYQQFVSEIKIL